MSKRTDGKTASQVAQEAANLRRATEEDAVDSVNPGSAHTGRVGAEETDQQVQYQLDPQLVQQANQNRFARLMAMMVHENAMMEVALDQERAARHEAEAKLAALQQVYGVHTGADS